MIRPTSGARQYRIIIWGDCRRLVANLAGNVQVEPSLNGDTSVIALVRDDLEFWGLIQQLRDLALRVVAFQELGSGNRQAGQPAGMEHAGIPGTSVEFARLDRGESIRLLASAQVGRLIFTVSALPAVRVMNFATADGLIVLRTAADTTVARQVADVIVAFEVDDLDVATSSGWSVTVTGRATLVNEPELIAQYQRLPLVPWAPGQRDQFVTLTTEIVEGRRIRRVAGPADPQQKLGHASRDPQRG